MSYISKAQLVTERGRAEPASLRHIEHDAVRSGPLHLDVALCARPDAERLLDVVTAARPCCGEPLRDRLEALYLKADVVDAGEVLAALAAGRRIVLEIEDGEVDVAVGEEDAARPRIVDLADFLHAERLDVELRGLLESWVDSAMCLIFGIGILHALGFGSRRSLRTLGQSNPNPRRSG